MKRIHSFHIPVMGTGFTIDTPIKIAHYGISSVISIVDDQLIERMREYYCQKLQLPFDPITEKVLDFRAKRITAYLNLVHQIVGNKFENLLQSLLEKKGEIEKYMDMLPAFSSLKKEYMTLLEANTPLHQLKTWLQRNLSCGSIDVNIMTKLDKENYSKDEKLPVEYNDAHAALRGFAQSELEASLVLSAGMNPRLYNYLEQFEDFYPQPGKSNKKKIVLKVSDYRSALIQGKYLAKKGLWVDEYRIESGLNCGGHAFATDGHLMGPILEEFKQNRKALGQSVFSLYVEALTSKKRYCPEEIPDVAISAQGGLGTAEEHQFLLEHYQINSVGWGSPFLLVPEATNVDPSTRKQLSKAEEKDLYLSNISPLGVPFNNLRNNSKDQEKERLIEKERPGSSCPKKYLVSNKDFTEEALCTASRHYQHLKLKKLEAQQLSPEEYRTEYDKIVEKSCICVGLGTPALLVNGMDTRKEGEGVSVCPGPNMAYFSKVVSLRDMVRHIYGKANVIQRKDRPSLFIKELEMYVTYFKNKLQESSGNKTAKSEKYLKTFKNNLLKGIAYYQELFTCFGAQLELFNPQMLVKMNRLELELQAVEIA
ncbi:hypothetical protein AAG747_10140 [Rapidithrix thailandica]|uniref:Uncharacterized protein n=1 Tax=Rapidithrix thailandica TaxID=413964 RepID=A0AAW9RX39_9BACT